MAKRKLYDAEGKEVEVEMPEEVTLAALGSQIHEIQNSIAQINAAIAEGKGNNTFDGEKALAAMQTELNALRDLVNDVKTKRRSQSSGATDPVDMVIPSGPLRGKRYSDAVSVYRWLSKYENPESRREWNSSIANAYRPPSAELKAAVDEYRAYTTSGSGAGAEWMPAGNMADRIWQDIYLGSPVVGQFPVITGDLTDPFEFSLDLDDSGDEWTQGIQNVDVVESNAATRDSVMRFTELVNAKAFSKNMQENALFALMPLFESYLRRTGREMMDKYLMNADKVSTSTGNINRDDGTPSSTAYYLVGSSHQDGLRKQGIIDNTAQLVNAGGDALVIADMNLGLSKLDKYASMPRDVRVFTNIKTWLNGISALAELQTVDKYGMKATILNNEVANFKGSPIIITPAVPLTEADGKVSATSSNNTLGQIVLTNVNSWIVGFMRNLEIESEYRPLSRKLIIVGSFRQGVASFGTRSSAIHTAVIRNILIA